LLNFSQSSHVSMSIAPSGNANSARRPGFCRLIDFAPASSPIEATPKKGTHGLFSYSLEFRVVVHPKVDWIDVGLVSDLIRSALVDASPDDRESNIHSLHRLRIEKCPPIRWPLFMKSHESQEKVGRPSIRASRSTSRVLTKTSNAEHLTPNFQPRGKRVKGIEPSCVAWEATVLPLNYTRVKILDLRFPIADCNPNHRPSKIAKMPGRQ
jgi:hypothetical protein